MVKYINANKLCEDLINRWEIADKEKEKEIQNVMADIVTPIVIGQPSADVVEVVRCKDCKHWQTENKPNSKSDYRLCEYYRGYKSPDGFCDLGERKDNEKL